MVPVFLSGDNDLRDLPAQSGQGTAFGGHQVLVSAPSGRFLNAGSFDRNRLLGILAGNAPAGDEPGFSSQAAVKSDHLQRCLCLWGRVSEFNFCMSATDTTRREMGGGARLARLLPLFPFTMSRALRLNIPDGIYHVASRGLERRRIVRDDLDRQRWIELLDRVATRRGWRVYAWALMDNHYHIFLKVHRADLSEGMHHLNSAYATVFNRQHQRCGPLFQGRFKSVLVQTDYHYWELTRYVHLNPVRAELTDDATSYPWSSCALYFRTELAPSWLAWEEVLLEYGTCLQTAQESYRRFLMEGLEQNVPSPLDAARISSLLGKPTFVARMMDCLRSDYDSKDIPDADRLHRLFHPDEVVSAVCTVLETNDEQVLRKGRHGNRPRWIALYLCSSRTSSSYRDLGRYFGGASGQAVRTVVEKVEQAMRYDHRIKEQVWSVQQELNKRLNSET